MNRLKYQPFLRERVRESASWERVKRQRGIPRLNSKMLSPPLFCWWRQNPLKQSAQNKCTWAGGPKVTWLFHTELHGSILGGQGRGEGEGWWWGRVWYTRALHYSPCLLFYMAFWNCGYAKACSTAAVNGTCWSAHFLSLWLGCGYRDTLTTDPWPKSCLKNRVLNMFTLNM